MHSQKSITSPEKVKYGEEYRSSQLFSSNNIFKFYKFLYENKDFDLYHGWTKEMETVLYRETVNGRLKSFYASTIRTCSNFPDAIRDMMVPNINLIEMVLTCSAHSA